MISVRIFLSLFFTTACLLRVVRSKDLVQYTKNDVDFNSKLNAARQFNQLIIVYIVNNGDYQDVDKAVVALASEFPTVSIINVNTSICKGVSRQYPDEGNTEITAFPVFVVQKFEINLARFIGFDAKKLRFQILLYKDSTRYSVEIDGHSLTFTSGASTSSSLQRNYSLEQGQRTEESGESSGFIFLELKNDSEFENQIYNIVDKQDLWSAIFFVDTDSYDSSIDRLASISSDKILFFKINTSKCQRARQQFNIKTLPSVVFRRYGKNNSTLVSPNLTDLKDGDLVHKLLLLYSSSSSKETGSSSTGQSTSYEQISEEDDTNTYNNPVGSSNQKIPVLKNGSTINLKNNIRGITNGWFTLINTCAFDSFASIIMIAYKDSIDYRQKVDLRTNGFLEFISKIANNGITKSTYKDRTELIINKTNPQMVNTMFTFYRVPCETTVSKIVESMFNDLPTKVDTKLSIANDESKIYTPIKPNAYITYQTPTGRIENLQSFLNTCFQREILEDSVIVKNISDMHLFIDVLTWNEDSLIRRRKSNTTEQVKMQLRDIPKRLTYNSTTYHLRGVMNFKPGGSFLRLLSPLGHYYTYALRSDGTWLLIDDVNAKSKLVGDEKKAKIDLLVYTI